MNLFELYAKLGLDTSEYEKGIEGAKKQANGLMEVFKGTFLADMAKQALGYAIDVGKQAVQMASDLAEVQNVVDVTFGDGADQINVWAKNLKNSFGIGELSAKRFSGTMGAMLKSMGMTDEETMEMSTSLVELTADMASFYNLDHEEAFQKIRAGISGETEPLKQLGINMSVANLEAYAMSQGITKAYNAMTQAEQATLRYNYLLSTTAGAQGDFARTSESYSNQVKLFKENVNDILEQAGQVVIDVINPVLKNINEALSDLTKETVEEQIAGVEKSEQQELLEADLKKARADTLIDTLDELSQKTELSEYETKLWESALQELVATFPELAAHIDLANKSILTSTDEIRENTEAAWQNAREKAKIRALEQKEQIRANAMAAAADAQIALEIQKAESKVLLDEYYTDLQNFLIEKGLISSGQTLSKDELDQKAIAMYNYADEPAQMLTKKFLQADEAVRKVEELETAYKEANDEFERADENYKKTYEALGNLAIEYENETAAIEAATQAQNDYNTALENEVKAFETVEKAWTAVKEHRDETYNQMRESLKNGTNDLWGVVADLTEIDINKSLETAQANMGKNINFYAQYAANLRNAQRAGVDEGLLAELAREQNAENYALLEYLYTQAKPVEINRLNKSWQDLQATKDTLATTMTDATLAVDEGYASMVETAQKAVDELNQYETARQNAYETGAGVVDGISAKIPEIEEKMRQINEIMQSVGATPISIDFDLGGNAGAANNLETAIANGAERGTRSAIAAQKLSVDAALLARALLPTINAAMNVKIIEGRYG